MLRILVLAAACVTAVPVTPVMAQTESSPAKQESPEQRAERCGIQAGIVKDAIRHRKFNRSQARATKKITRSAPIKGTKYEQSVDVLVSWIYTIPAKQLNNETVDAFETACLNYNG